MSTPIKSCPEPIYTYTFFLATLLVKTALTCFILDPTLEIVKLSPSVLLSTLSFLNNSVPLLS